MGMGALGRIFKAVVIIAVVLVLGAFMGGLLQSPSESGGSRAPESPAPPATPETPPATTTTPQGYETPPTATVTTVASETTPATETTGTAGQATGTTATKATSAFASLFKDGTPPYFSVTPVTVGLVMKPGSEGEAVFRVYSWGGYEGSIDRVLALGRYSSVYGIREVKGVDVGGFEVEGDVVRVRISVSDETPPGIHPILLAFLDDDERLASFTLLTVKVLPSPGFVLRPLVEGPVVLRPGETVELPVRVEPIGGYSSRVTLAVTAVEHAYVTRPKVSIVNASGTPPFEARVRIEVPEEVSSGNIPWQLIIVVRGEGEDGRTSLLVLDAGLRKPPRDGGGLLSLFLGFLSALFAIVVLPLTAVLGAVSGFTLSLAISSATLAPITVVAGGDFFPALEVLEASAQGAGYGVEALLPENFYKAPLAATMVEGVPTVYVLGHIIPSGKGFSLNMPGDSVTAVCSEDGWSVGSIVYSMAYTDPKVLEGIEILAISHRGEGNPPIVHKVTLEDLGEGLAQVKVDFKLRYYSSVSLYIYPKGEAPDPEKDLIPVYDEKALLIHHVKVKLCNAIQPPGDSRFFALPGYKVVVPFTMPYTNRLFTVDVDLPRDNKDLTGASVKAIHVVEGEYTVKNPTTAYVDKALKGYLVVEYPEEAYKEGEPNVLKVSLKEKAAWRWKPYTTFYIIVPPNYK